MALDVVLFGGLLWARILFVAAASVLCWILIARSKPSRAHVGRHAFCLAASALVVVAYQRQHLEPYHGLYIAGLYWFATMLPSIRMSLSRRRGLFDFTNYEFAKFVLSIAAGYGVSDYLMSLVASFVAFGFAWDCFRAKREMPELSGPQVKPIS